MRRWVFPLAALGLSHAAGAAELDLGYLRGSGGPPTYQVIQAPAQEWNAAPYRPVMASPAAPVAPPVPSCWVNDITRANNQVSLDFTETSFWYGPEIDEPESGITPVHPGLPLDAETAYLPGLQVTGSAMANIGAICNLYISGSFSWFQGNTSYFQFGGPSATNQATVEDSDFRLGKGFNVGPNAMITPYFGAGTNSWNRYLTGPGGYREIYTHDYAGAGVLLQYSPGPGWVLSVDGLIGEAFNSSMTTSLTPGGFPIIPATYGITNKPVYMVGGSVDYAITEHLHANAGVEYTYFQYGESPWYPVPALGPGVFQNEPNSTTSYLTAFIGLGYHW